MRVPAVFLIRERFDHHLRDRRPKDCDQRRHLDGIGWQHDLGWVLLFPERVDIETPNGREVRWMLEEVIAGGVSHGLTDERMTGITGR